MSLRVFQNARNFTVGNIEIRVDADTFTHTDSPTEAPNHDLTGLLQAVAVGALSDSAERFDAPKCMPETRVAVQDNILSWITYGDSDAQPKDILWVTGPAGTGKTAILGSVADDCKERGLLGASFFFSSYSPSQERRSKTCFIPTLAYQLLQHPEIHDASESVLQALKRDPAIFQKRLSEQLEVLILKPLRELSSKRRDSGIDFDIARWPRVILIDGLDECVAQRHAHEPPCRRADADDQVEILQALLQAVCDPAFPFRVVIASRPERRIRDFFSTIGQESFVELFLDERYEPDADIALYLRSKFDDIRRRYNLPSSWPGERIIRVLVANASGQFIYPATVIRFIDVSNQHPYNQLECVLKSRPATDGTKPFAALDALYTAILHSSPCPITSVKWLRALPTETGVGQPKFFFHFYDADVNAFRLPSTLFVNQVFENLPGEAEHVLGNLTSLLYIPPVAERDGRAYLFHHKSFLDYIYEEERCGDLYLPADVIETFYRERYFAVVRNKGPIVPLDPASQELFMKHFLPLHTRMFRFPTKPSFKSVEAQLLASPVEWWVNAYIDWRSIHTRKDVDGPIDILFREVHACCNPFRCRLACERWRKAIIAVCEARNWRLPTSFELLQRSIRATFRDLPLSGMLSDNPTRRGVAPMRLTA